VSPEIRIEHRYPEALAFVHEHGSDALVVLHDLIAHSEQHGSDLVVQASVREIAARISFLSKDTVHRRLRQLRHAHVINTAIPTTTTPFEKPTYTVDLTGTGIRVATDRHPGTPRSSTPPS